MINVEHVPAFENESEHIKRSRIFDTQQFDARCMTRLGFFGQRDKDSVLPLTEPWTNLYLGDQLPSGKAMLVSGIVVQVFKAQFPFGDVDVPALRFATLSLQKLDKIYIQLTDVQALHPNLPLVKFDPREIEPMLIPPAQFFGVQIKFGLQSPGDIRAHSDLLMRVSLIGEIARAVS